MIFVLFSRILYIQKFFLTIIVSFSSHFFPYLIMTFGFRTVIPALHLWSIYQVFRLKVWKLSTKYLTPFFDPFLHHFFLFKHEKHRLFSDSFTAKNILASVVSWLLQHFCSQLCYVLCNHPIMLSKKITFFYDILFLSTFLRTVQLRNIFNELVKLYNYNINSCTKNLYFSYYIDLSLHWLFETELYSILSSRTSSTFKRIYFKRLLLNWTSKSFVVSIFYVYLANKYARMNSAPFHNNLF